MAYHDGEEDEKIKGGTASDDVQGAALDEDADEEVGLLSDALPDDEKAWE